MAATATKTPSARKTLADQLDRLDSILDGLAEGLDGAVADAVRSALMDALPAAVREEVAAALADPETVARFRDAVVPNDSAKGGHRRAGRMSRLWNRITSAVRGRLNAIRDAVDARLRRLAGGFGSLTAALWRWRKPAGVAVLAGVAAAMVITAVGPVFAPWLCGFAAGTARRCSSREAMPATGGSSPSPGRSMRPARVNLPGSSCRRPGCRCRRRSSRHRT